MYLGKEQNWFNGHASKGWIEDNWASSFPGSFPYPTPLGGGGRGEGVGRKSWEDNWKGNVKFIESCCEETYFKTCDKQQE